MKAILVKYLPPTNVKGSRIKASAEGIPSITRPYDHAENDGGRRKVAEELANKYGWLTPRNGRLIEGGLPNGDCAFVFANSDQ